MSNLIEKKKEEAEEKKIKVSIFKTLFEKEFSWASFSQKEKKIKISIWFENIKGYPEEVVLKSLKHYLLEVEKRKHDIAVFFQDYLLPNFQSFELANKNQKTLTLLEKPALTEEEIEKFNKEIEKIFAEKSI